MRFFLLFVLYFSAITVFSQTIIKGKIKDEKGEALSFASIYLAKSGEGTLSDDDGNFELKTNGSGADTLTITRVECKKQEQVVELSGKPIELNIVMKPEDFEIEEVVITAGTFEASDRKRSVVLRPLDIVTTAGANGDIYGALNTLPGAMQVGDQTGIFVRGGSGSEASTIIDGLLVPNPFFGSTPDIPQRGRFSPFQFKGTVFSTGAYSAEYGQALSSIVSLESQDLAKQSFTSLGLLAVGTSMSHQQAWEKTSLNLSTNYSNLKPYLQLMNANRDWIKEPESYGGSVVFRHKTKNGIFKAYSYYNSNELKLYTNNLDKPEGTEQFHNKNDNFYYNGTYTTTLGSKWSAYFGSAVSFDRQKIAFDTLNVPIETQNFHGKVKFMGPLFGKNTINFGLENMYFVGNYGFNQYSTTLYDNYTAFYAESDLPISKKFVARIGFRTEHNSIINKFNLAPRASVALKTGKKSQISMAYGLFYQRPAMDLLRQQKKLKYEEAQHIILNYQWQLQDERTFRIELYHKPYNSLAKYTFDSLSILNNNGYGYAQGVDIFWRDKKSIKNFDYWLSYSYVNTQRLYLDFPQEATPTFVSKHNFSAVTKYYWSALRLQLGLTYAYNSGRPYYNPNNPNYLNDYTPEVHSISMNLSYLTTIADNFTIVFLSINNPLNIRYIYGYQYSSDGTKRKAIEPSLLRSAFVGVFVSFNNKKKKKKKETKSEP